MQYLYVYLPRRYTYKEKLFKSLNTYIYSHVS